jgi:hypothetical protein
MVRTVLLVALAVVGGGLAHAQAPSSEELHRLMEEKRYPQALQKITAGLALKGQAAKQVNRYELLMLKGECHLRGKALGMAAEAFAAAAREPLAAPSERAVAAAHEMLIRQSKAFAYSPKPAATGARVGAGAAVEKSRPAPIDILDPESRKRAFAAMLDDELTANEDELAAAKAARQLGPVAAVFKPLATMEGLELAATGDAVRVRAIEADLADRAKRSISDALRALSKRVGEIDKEASAFVEIYQDEQDPLAGYPRPIRRKVYKRKGPTEAQLTELQQANATCDRLPQAIAEIAEGLRVPERTFEAFGDEAGRIRKEVDRLLDTDYLKVYREIPKK